MNKIVGVAIAILLATNFCFSQIKKATLQASGLTCALCARSIFTNLSALDFVDNVDTDLESSSFLITFKRSGKFDIGAIKKKVEDAGFSISSLMLTVEAEGLVIGNDQKIRLGDNVYHFVNVDKQRTLSSFKMRIVDPAFLSAKEYKKISSRSTLACFQPTKSLPCTIPATETGVLGIYHVSL